MKTLSTILALSLLALPLTARAEEGRHSGTSLE